MQLGYRGSANRWECDENDHVNVRFHLDRHWQTLCGALPGLSLGAFAAGELKTGLTTQHLRFIAEVRAAEPMSGYAVCVAVGSESAQVATLVQHTASNKIFSTCVHTIEGLNTQLVESTTESMPELTGPRGIADQDTPHARLSMNECEAFGLFHLGEGVVSDQETDADGLLAVPGYMGRMSDSMPNLWDTLAGDVFSAEGGAVLEYRLRYHNQLGRGDRMRLYSGLSGVGQKVQNFIHLLFNAKTGDLCVSSAAASVRMDLEARKALALSENVQAIMRKKLIKPF